MIMWGWDPGKATGWCRLSIEEGKIESFICGETDHIGVGNMLLYFPKPETETVFIVEKYLMSSKISQAPWTLESTGLIRYFTAVHNIPMEMVLPSAHKKLISDVIINRAGLWVPGKEHAMDAVRMCLWYLTTKRGLLTECLRASS